MLATTLLAALRGRGFSVRVARPAEGAVRLLVRPAGCLTDQERVALQVKKLALLTLLEAEAADPTTPLRLWDRDVMIALEVFPGAQVIAHGVPAVWPPEGGWLPAPLRRVDTYTAAPPMVSCPTCASSTWHRAGSGWTCSACHPSPRTTDRQRAAHQVRTSG